MVKIFCRFEKIKKANFFTKILNSNISFENFNLFLYKKKKN